MVALVSLALLIQFSTITKFINNEVSSIQLLSSFTEDNSVILHISSVD